MWLLDAGREVGEHDRKATNMRTDPKDTVAAWRSGTDPNSPAGPLFTGGMYAESEIAMNGRVGTGHCGSNCSGSHTAECC
jgi:hypothetical protein